MSGSSILSYLILSLTIGYVFTMPYFSEVSSLLDQKKTYEDSLATAASIETKKNALMEEFKNISPEDKQNIDAILPSSSDYVKLLSDIDNVGKKYGITPDRVSFKELNPSSGDSIADAAPAKPYASGILGFSFSATYEKFNSFMSDLEKSLQIMDVRSVRINTAQNGIYEYNVEFETYWLK